MHNDCAYIIIRAQKSSDIVHLMFFLPGNCARLLLYAQKYKKTGHEESIILIISHTNLYSDIKFLSLLVC